MSAEDDYTDFLTTHTEEVISEKEAFSRRPLKDQLKFEAEALAEQYGHNILVAKFDPETNVLVFAFSQDDFRAAQAIGGTLSAVAELSMIKQREAQLIEALGMNGGEL